MMFKSFQVAVLCFAVSEAAVRGYYACGINGFASINRCDNNSFCWPVTCDLGGKGKDCSLSKADYCEDKPVYGGWTKKTECSTTCGEGFQTFERTCTGTGCVDSEKTQNRACNVKPCPRCGDLSLKECKKKGRQLGLGCFKWKKSYCADKDDLPAVEKTQLCKKMMKGNARKISRKCRKKTGGVCKYENNECVVA